MRSRLKHLLIFLLLLLIFIISVIFGMQNGHQVTVNYLLAQGKYSVSSLIAVSFGVGCVTGLMSYGLCYLKIRILLAIAERRIKQIKHDASMFSNVTVSTETPIANE